MKAVVLLSGGVDSTVLVAHHLAKGNEVVAVTFDYNQTHAKELSAAAQIAGHYDIPHRIIRLDMLTGSALTGQGDIPQGHADSIDATYVPGRNIVFIAIGAAIADSISAAAVAYGANKDDFGGYPDCRPRFLTAIDDAVGIGTRRGVSVSAPFMALTKQQVIDYGRELDAPLALTWSCYHGGEVPCGECGACAA